MNLFQLHRKYYSNRNQKKKKKYTQNLITQSIEMFIFKRSKHVWIIVRLSKNHHTKNATLIKGNKKEKTRAETN